MVDTAFYPCPPSLSLQTLCRYSPQLLHLALVALWGGQMLFKLFPVGGIPNREHLSKYLLQIMLWIILLLCVLHIDIGSKILQQICVRVREDLVLCLRKREMQYREKRYYTKSSYPSAHVNINCQAHVSLDD